MEKVWGVVARVRTSDATVARELVVEISVAFYCDQYGTATAALPVLLSLHYLVRCNIKDG